MAHLWLQREEYWGIIPLDGRPAVLTGDPAHPIRQEDREAPVLGSVCPQECSTADWLLVCKPGALRVNGALVATGIRVLSDRDEIVAPGSRIFYSSEVLAKITPFVGGNETAVCPRCLLPICTGDLAVQCPVCRLSYHQNDETGLACWTYGPCACGRETTLDTVYTFCPEDL